VWRLSLAWWLVVVAEEEEGDKTIVATAAPKSSSVTGWGTIYGTGHCNGSYDNNCPFIVNNDNNAVLITNISLQDYNALSP
jgi:hypothetical protein